LNFERPDLNRFPCLGLAYEAAKKKGTMPAVLNAANETAVKGFLEMKLKFMHIPLVVEKVLLKHRNKKDPALDDILEADRWSREQAQILISRLNS